MNTQDITKEQLETLILIRSLEEFVTDEHENLSSLSEVIWTLEESLSDKEHEQLVADICKLTEKGYLLSDGTEEHIKADRIPEVEGITPKGQSALNEWEKDIRGSIDKGENESSDIHLHLSLLGGVTINNSLLGISDSLFDSIGNIVKELLHI